MGWVSLTKRVEFAASHRYYNPRWSEGENRRIFGACANPHGHGHNYLLEVTVGGAVDPVDGMVVNLYDLKEALGDVLQEFDHKNLNLDTPYFVERIPTTENLARVLFWVLAKQSGIATLEKVRLYEDETLFAEVEGPLTTPQAIEDIAHARITRVYHFCAGHRLEACCLSDQGNRRLDGNATNDIHGHNYELEVTMQGLIDHQTGMVVNLPRLDEFVRSCVVERLDHKDLGNLPELANRIPTGGSLTGLIWQWVEKEEPRHLTRIRVTESPETTFERVEVRQRGSEDVKPLRSGLAAGSP